jgi:signal transduction histidine kinase
MFKYYRLYVLILLLCFLPNVLYAVTPTLILTDETMSIGLIPYANILEDPTGQLTLKAVTSGTDNFHAPLNIKNNHAPLSIKNNHVLNMGFTQSTFWLRIQITNQSKKTDWYLHHSGGLARQVQVYLKSDDFSQPAIKLTLMNHSRGIKFSFYSPLGSSHSLYVRVQDKQTPLVIGADLISASSMLKWIMTDYPLYSFVLGGLLVLALYNFLYFLYLRDTGFLALSFFIVAFVLEMGNHVGVLFYYTFLREFLRPVGSLFAFIAIISAMSLLYQWLNIPKNLPQWKTPFIVAFVVGVGFAIVTPFFPYSIAIAGIWAIFLLFISLVIIILFYQKGLRLPLSMGLAILVFIVSIIPSLLTGAGFIGNVGFLTDMTFVALLIALVLLSLTQAEQVRYKGQQAERIAAMNQSKDEFLTTMSHELRTPMNAVVGAGNLLKRTSLSEDQQAFVSRLNISSQHMLSLINDILDLARVDSNLLRMESIPFSLDTILGQLKQLLIEETRKHHLQLTLNNQFDPIKKQLLGDPTRLQQILLNLLSNAIKFTQEGNVSLTVIVEAVSANRVRLRLEVRDSGIGISAEQQQALFKPFSQADQSTARQYGGSGLGLAISHKLVQQMGGELNVTSRLEQGSCFFFTLNFPLQETLAETSSTTVSPTLSKTAFANLHILLVDDDEMNRFFGAKLFKAIGVQVDTADSGEQAILSLQTQHFDLVFMDVSMPGIDGYETTRRIRVEDGFSDLPIIALTAHAIAGIRERCLAAGMDDYLTKPFDVEQLEKMVRQWTA